jgi:hypothetical protein
MEGFFNQIMNLGGEDRKIAPPGVYHLKARSDSAGTRSENVKSIRARKRRAIKYFSRKMSHRKLKLDGLYDFSLRGCSYADFLPMHKLWIQYITSVLSKHGPGASLEQLGAKILKVRFFFFFFCCFFLLLG